MPRYTIHKHVTRYPDPNPVVSVFGAVCALGMVLAMFSMAFIGALVLAGAVIIVLIIAELITRINRNINRRK